MTRDVAAVMWKERKMLFRRRGSRVQVVLTAIVPLGMFAVWFPLQVGPRWTTGFLSLFPALVVPVLLVGLIVPDSVAGERERHTLETLLASRLPDRGILIGKMALPVALAWLATVIVLALSLVVTNILHFRHAPLVFAPRALLLDLTTSLLLAVLTAALGVLISLRSATVQEAQQTLLGSLLAAPMVLGLFPPILMAFRPEWFQAVMDFIKGLDFGLTVAGVLLLLLVTDLALVRRASARFVRGRLIAG